MSYLHSLRALVLGAVVSTTAALLGVSVATAQTVPPEIRLQDSQSFAIGNQLRAFRVPVRSSTGVIRFYDVTVTLGAAAAGTVNPSATVTSVLSPSIATGVIVPGTYRSADTRTTCVVRNVTLTGGRIQSFFACSHATSGAFEMSVATGTVGAGHPFQTILAAQGIPSRPDVASATWGIVTPGNFRVNSCDGFLGDDTGNAVGVKTNGSQIFIDLFRAGFNNALFCSTTLSRV